MPLGQTLAGLAPVAGSTIGALAGGPLGSLVGRGIGSVAGNLASDYFQQQSPASQARSQLLQQLQGQAPYQRTNFDPIAQEELRRYRTETVPGIANQFAGLGGLDSSGFRQALTGSGQDLQTRLAALRAQHEMSQNQFASGAEERRRQMLANLSGGMYGEEREQQMDRMNQMNQIASQFPGQLMDMARFQREGGQNQLRDILSQLLSQQNAQNTAIDQTGQVVNGAMDRTIENIIRQNPTAADIASRYGMEALKSVIQAAGTIGGAAIGI